MGKDTESMFTDTSILSQRIENIQSKQNIVNLNKAIPGIQSIDIHK